MKKVLQFPRKEQLIEDGGQNEPRKLVNIAESTKFKHSTVRVMHPASLNFRWGVDEWPFSVA